MWIAEERGSDLEWNCKQVSACSQSQGGGNHWSIIEGLISCLEFW